MKFVPVSVNVNAAPPAPVVVGEIVVSVGTGFGALIVKLNTFDVVPVGSAKGRARFGVPKTTVGVNTCTEAVPAVAISAAVIAAVSCVALTKVVVRLPPFHCTAEVFRKLLPFTVSVNAAAPAVAELGRREPSTGTGVVMLNCTAFDVPPPGAGFATEMRATFAL